MRREVEKSNRSKRAIASFIAQLALMGGMSVVLVACVLVGTLWYREGSPNPFVDLLRGDQKPKTVLSASEPRGAAASPSSEVNNSLSFDDPSTGLRTSSPPSEAHPPDAGVAISTPETTASDRDSSPSPGESAVGQAPTGLPASLPERPATRIVIPAIDIDAPVVVTPVRNGTWDVKQLTHEVGHLQGTASPGDRSNVVMAGHVTLTGGGYGPFRGLAQLQPGDEVLVYVSDQDYVYIVDSVGTVEATDVEVTYPTAEPILTLITCVNWDPVQGRYSDRLVIVAHLGG